MKLAELYREWLAGGVMLGGVPMHSETKYMHRSELAMVAIEELEERVKILTSHINHGMNFDGESDLVTIGPDGHGTTN